MRPPLSARKLKIRCLTNALAAFSAAALLTVSVAPADARNSNDGKTSESTEARPAGKPVMAIISLRNQRITIYDTQGVIMRASVSSGRTGYETPAGIYSVIQKKAEHYSNLYDDASMPFMQRITWSGIALHAGALPGYPASHGCIRMPLSFAEQLFQLTSMGMRVVVMRDDIAPSDFSHTGLFKPRIGEDSPLAKSAPDGNPADVQTGMTLAKSEAAAGIVSDAPVSAPMRSIRKLVAEKTALLEAATEKANEARRVARQMTMDSARAVKTARMAEATRGRAEAFLKQLETPASGVAEPAPDALAAAQAKLKDATQIADTAKAEAAPLLEAVPGARETAKNAEEARLVALGELREMERKAAPISVFISLKEQRLYVRQAFRPLFESEVTIRDPATPIGTHLLTALEYIDGGEDVRWSTVSMYAADTAKVINVSTSSGKRSDRSSNGRTLTADVAGASAAIDRVTIPKEAMGRIAELISPGSSVIISDEPVSKETGTGTDFIVVMSTEPQGGIATRRRSPPIERFRYERYRPAPSGNLFSWW